MVKILSRPKASKILQEQISNSGPRVKILSRPKASKILQELISNSGPRVKILSRPKAFGKSSNWDARGCARCGRSA